MDPKYSVIMRLHCIHYVLVLLISFCPENVVCFLRLPQMTRRKIQIIYTALLYELAFTAMWGCGLVFPQSKAMEFMVSTWMGGPLLNLVETAIWYFFVCGLTFQSTAMVMSK